MQYLSFRVEQCKMIVSVDEIQEIVHSYKITSLPKTPDELEGVLNLRGYYLPVISLKKRIGISYKSLSEDDTLNSDQNLMRKCILVTSVIYDDQIWSAGLEVDEVHDCLIIDEGLWRPPPSQGNKISTEFINAMVNLEGKTYHRLNIETIIDPDDILERYYNGVSKFHDKSRTTARTA